MTNHERVVMERNLYTYLGRRTGFTLRNCKERRNGRSYEIYASSSLRRLRPGPPAKLAAARPMRCLAACDPENPLPKPKSRPRLELKHYKVFIEIY